MPDLSCNRLKRQVIVSSCCAYLGLGLGGSQGLHHGLTGGQTPTPWVGQHAGIGEEGGVVGAGGGQAAVGPEGVLGETVGGTEQAEGS